MKDAQKVFPLPSSKVEMTCLDYVLWKKETRGICKRAMEDVKYAETAAEQAHRSLKPSLGRGRTYRKLLFQIPVTLISCICKRFSPRFLFYKKT
jgi:hypothetical protein